MKMRTDRRTDRLGRGGGVWGLWPLAAQRYLEVKPEHCSLALWRPACQPSTSASFISESGSPVTGGGICFLKSNFILSCLEVRAVNQRHTSPVLSLCVSTCRRSRVLARTRGKRLPGLTGPHSSTVFTHLFSQSFNKAGHLRERILEF